MVDDGHGKEFSRVNSESVEGAGRSWTIGPPRFVYDAGDLTGHREMGGKTLNDCELPLAKSTRGPEPT